jgi:hypothetical protein
VHVFASVSLKVNVSGSGNVYYGGNPTSPEIHIAGSGTVKAEKRRNYEPRISLSSQAKKQVLAKC